jgi:hypothetical protein
VESSSWLRDRAKTHTHHGNISTHKACTVLLSGNCYCHVLHNSVKHGNNHLLFDIEAAILKIYSHFSRSSVRSQELGKYFEFVDQEQKVMKYI